MRNQAEQRKERWAGLENLWSTSAVVLWMGFVAAAMARFVAFRLANEFIVPIMVVSALSTVGTLYWMLLK